MFAPEKKTFSYSQRLHNILVTKSKTFESKNELQDVLKYTYTYTLFVAEPQHKRKLSLSPRKPQ